MKKILITLSLLLISAQPVFASTLFIDSNSVTLSESLVPNCAQGVDTLILLKNNTGATVGADEGLQVGCGSLNDQGQEDSALPNGNAQFFYDNLQYLNPSEQWDVTTLPIELIVLEIDGDYEGNPGTDDYDAIKLDPGYVGEDTLTLLPTETISRAILVTALAGSVTDISSIAMTTLSLLLAFVGLLIAGGFAWRFFKRHIGKKI